MKKVTATGKTIEEATSIALGRLGVVREQAEIRVITEPSRGRLFGLFGVKLAEVEAIVVEEAVEETPTAETPVEETAVVKGVADDPVGVARRYLVDILRAMDVVADVEVSRDPDVVTFEIRGEDLGIVIGKHGQTLDALQYLVNLAANRSSDHFIRIVLDAEGYRSRRKEALLRLADRMATQAVAQRRSVMMEPMSSQERKVIHLSLQNRPDVTTVSQGEEPNRRIMIVPKN